MTVITRSVVSTAVALAALCAGPAQAHHGWSWAEEAQSELAGTVQRVQIAPPHPTLEVKTVEGALWRVELGNPSQTERSGFTAASAKPGDAITAIGNRDRDASQRRMKAVQIQVGGKTYALYPERIQNPKR